MIKLIASDMDGTLLNNNHDIDMSFIKSDSEDDINKFDEIAKVQDFGCKNNCKTIKKCCKRGGF